MGGMCITPRTGANTPRDVMHHATHCESQVRRAPLALYAARYGGGGGGGSGSGGGHGGESGAGGGAGGGGGITQQQQQAPQPQPLAACFPEHTPDRTRSRWYSFPAMRPDELLLFTQYGAIRITLTTAVLTMSPIPQARPYHVSAMPIQTASSVGRRSCGTARCRGWSRGTRGAGTPPPRRHAAPSKCVLSCCSRSSCRRRAATAGGPAIPTAPYIVHALLLPLIKSLPSCTAPSVAVLLLLRRATVGSRGGAAGRC